MNRKAQVSGFSEMPWALLLLVILVVFAIFMNAQATAQASKALQPVSWEPQWLANSLAQHPLGDQTVLEALRDPANDEELETLVKRVLNDTITQESELITIFLVREQTRVACYRRSALGPPERSIRTVTQCSTGVVARNLPREGANPREALAAIDHPSGLAAGPGRTYVGVVEVRR